MSMLPVEWARRYSSRASALARGSTGVTQKYVVRSPCSNRPARLRSAPVLERLCLVLALTTLYLVSQGTQVVDQGQRRTVDPHWFRGGSYLKIGWHWVKRAIRTGQVLNPQLSLSSQPDPEPAIASRRQQAQRSAPVFLEALAPAA